jgi:hypothetical protein
MPRERERRACRADRRDPVFARGTPSDMFQRCPSTSRAVTERSLSHQVPRSSAQRGGRVALTVDVVSGEAGMSGGVRFRSLSDVQSGQTRWLASSPNSAVDGLPGVRNHGCARSGLPLCRLEPQRAAHPVAPAGARGRRRGRATGRDTTVSRRSGRGADYLDLGSDEYDHVLRRRAHQRRRSSRPEVRSGLLAEANVVRGEVTYGPVVRGQDFPLTVPAQALESLASAYHPDLEMVNRKRDTAIRADAGRAVAGGERAVRP